MKRAVSYMRVSTLNQIDNTSFETQAEKIELHCKLHDIELVKPFKDEGISAKGYEKRDDYKKMLKFISDESNKIDMVLVYKADRIHRSLKNLMIMIDYLQEINIDFISITEQFDTSTAQGLLFLQMLGSFSEFERKVIAERTKSGRLINAKRKIHPGGKPPFGYRLENKVYKVNEKEAEIVRQIFKLRSKGKSLKEIGKEIGMSKQRVHYILRNQMYKGRFIYDGEVEHNNISYKVERIVSDYIFNKVNPQKEGEWDNSLSFYIERLNIMFLNNNHNNKVSKYTYWIKKKTINKKY